MKWLNWLNQYKGYIASGLAALVLAANPAMVVTFINAHPRWSGIGLLAWSWLLHWAQGRRVLVAP